MVINFSKVGLSRDGNSQVWLLVALTEIAQFFCCGPSWAKHYTWYVLCYATPRPRRNILLAIIFRKVSEAKDVSWQWRASGMLECRLEVTYKRREECRGTILICYNGTRINWFFWTETLQTEKGYYTDLSIASLCVTPHVATYCITLKRSPPRTKVILDCSLQVLFCYHAFIYGSKIALSAKCP